MATSQPAILGDLQKYQWYVHMSRTEGADLDVIKAALKAGQADAAAQGVNLCLLVGPSLAADSRQCRATHLRRGFLHAADQPGSTGRLSASGNAFLTPPREG